jgi:putative DNA primase/helicase
VPAKPPFNLTDAGTAEEFMRRHGHVFRYVPVWKSWMTYDGARWARDEHGVLPRTLVKMLRAIVDEAQRYEDSDMRKAVITHAVRGEQASRIDAVTRLARNVAGYSVPHDVFDNAPLLLNVANGTLDLTTGLIQDHEPADHLTKACPVPWDLNANCPTWERFLLDVFAERIDVIDYVQRAVGYSLTGDTSEQCLQLMYGHGSNGKSTFLEVLQALFGDYGAQADFATFLENKSDGPRNDVARLAGARMVRSSEVGEGKRFNESLVKALTGSETIAARFLYSEAFEFRPTFKLWFAANHKPVIRGTDHAIWRRVRLLPFTVQFDGARRDKGLKDKLLAELPGILTWAVAGCLLWQQKGLEPPADILAATDEYRKDSDVIGSFLDDCCDLAPTIEVSATDLYQAFKRWAKDNGEYELSQTAFGRRLDERGFSVRKSGVKYRQGLRLNGNISPVTREERKPWFGQ